MRFVEGSAADDIPDKGTSFVMHGYANEAALIHANEPIRILADTNLHKY